MRLQVISIAAAVALLTAVMPRCTPHSSHPIRYMLVGTWTGTGAPSGPLLRPFGIAVAPTGEIYVTDERARVVHLRPDGEVAGEFGRQGRGPGRFTDPVGIAAGSDGCVFVADYDQDRIQQFTPTGRFVRAFGSSGSSDGQLSSPSGLAIGGDGSVYAADFYNNRITQFRPDGSFARTIGHGGRLGKGALHYPTGVAFTPNGDLIVADAYNYQLQWFDASGRAICRAGYHLFFLWPRPADGERGFNVPTSVAVGGDGRLHVADSANHRIVALSARGDYAGEWRLPNAPSGVNTPEQIAMSPDGTTLYTTDLPGNRVLVLKVGSP